MKFKNIMTILFVSFVVALALNQPRLHAGDTTRPSSTQAAEFSLHGKVKIGANIDLASPNLSKVVLYLDSDPGLDATPLSTVHATCAQRNKAFVPNFLVVPRNTEVEFPNWDHFSHNVFSRSAAAPAFDLDRYPYGQSKTRKFDKIGVVQVFCNIHPSMKALIFVTPNVYFTHADADGNFELTGIPAGKYELVAWQERCGQEYQNVEVGSGLNPELSFTLEEDRNSILANDPPQKKDAAYGVDHGLGIKRERLNLPVVQDSHPAPTTEPCDNCP